MRVKAGTNGETKDVDIMQVTPENYIVPENEKNRYHCLIGIEKFDSNTGKQITKLWLQKFGKKSFENKIQRSLKLQGNKVIILHNPNDWVAEIEAEKENRKAIDAEKQAQAKAEAEAKEKAERQKEIDEAVARALQNEKAKAKAAKKEINKKEQ